MLVCLPTLAAIVMLSGRCHGSDENNNNNNVTVTTAMLSASAISSQWTAATAAYQIAVTSSPLLTGDNGNDTAALQVSAVGKPSKFDEYVEDWQYVDDPLKNVTAVGVLPAGNNSSAASSSSVACKTCSIAKTKRNKRNHDDRLLKMSNHKSSLRHRQLYAELVAAAASASKQSYRRKRFRRSAVAAVDEVAEPDPVNMEPSTYKQLFRYKRYRRSPLAESTVAEQSYRRKRFRRSAVAAYPNGMIRPYRYQSGHQLQQPSYPSSSLGADLQQQQNRRWRYRYATDPYHHKRNGAATAWDRSVEFRRRYLRFPPTHDSPPPAFVNSNSNPWSPAIGGLVSGLPPPQSQLSSQPFSYLPQYPVQQSQPLPPPPPMGPRSPRLVFRDPVDQGTLQAPFGGGPNGLQDILVSQPEDVKGQCWFNAGWGAGDTRTGIGWMFVFYTMSII